MRDRTAKASVGASLALHAALALLVALVRAPATAPPQRDRTIEVTTYVAPAMAPANARTVASASHGERRSPLVKPAPAPHAEAALPSVAPTPAPEPAPAPAPTVDLFARDALARAVTSAPLDPGGHLRRAGDPAPPGDDERETVAARVRDSFADAAARERAASGNVAPHWRDLERTLTQGFHPPLAVVKQEGVAKALAHQILRAWLDGPPAMGPVPRGVDPSVDTPPGVPPGLGIRTTPTEQALAVQSRWGAPATSLGVEVEVILDEDGTIRSARVTRPSGRRAFDRAALAAVVEAIAKGGAPDEKCTVVTRWLVDAAVAVAPPTSIGFRFDETGHLDPNATGWRKYVGGTYPLQQTVHSHVSLVAVEPRR